MSARPLPPPKLPPMFGVGDIVRHIKTGRVYEVLSAPPHTPRDAATGEHVYLYDHDDEVWRWFRPQSEMEDGRFELVQGPQ